MAMPTERVRRPAVAGYFYPADAPALSVAIDALTQQEGAFLAASAVVVPHSSFQQSGGVAGATLARVAIPDCCVIVGASHTGGWMPWSLMTVGAYRTPLGDVPVDRAFAEALVGQCPFLTPDNWSQHGEHAIEVLVPFLQRLGPVGLSIVPIVTSSTDPEDLAQFATALAQVTRMREDRVLLIASSDLSHYETQGAGASKDRFLIDAICAVDAARLVGCLQEGTTLMCGYGAVAGVLEAARQLGARQGTLVRYGTSADAGGDPNSVTGYAGIVIR